MTSDIIDCVAKASLLIEELQKELRPVLSVRVNNKLDKAQEELLIAMTLDHNERALDHD